MKQISAVIMAAGKGKRLLPLTSTLPKPLIRIAGKTPLEYNLDKLVGHVSEIVIVVSYLKNETAEFLGNSYKGIKIKYAYQKTPEGTAQALFIAEKKVTGDEVLVLNGDDIYSENLILKALKKGSVLVGKKEEHWQKYGVLKLKNKKFLDHIEEKPQKYVGNLINIGLYKFNREIFHYFNKINKSARGEYEITDMITQYAKDYPIEVISSKTGWKAIGYPWDLLDLAESELENIKSDIKGKVEKGAVIKGKIHLGNNSIIKSGAYLEGNFYIGENCEIGPNCYIKGFGSIDHNTNIGNAVEITRSVIGKMTNIKHLSYIGDSVIGNGVNIGAGTKVANLRHDGTNVLVKVDSKLIDTGKKKFGAVVGDGVKTGVNTLLYPGTKLESKATTFPGEIVRFEINRN